MRLHDFVSLWLTTLAAGAHGRACRGQALTHDPGVIAGIAALLASTAALACAVPAWRAASVDPAMILRDE